MTAARRPRILIIEDEATSRQWTLRILVKDGYEVLLANDGREGLTKLRESAPDLVVCDIVMPGLDGFSLLETIQSDTLLSRIPFIFVTALADRQSQRRGMVSGADDFISKPFTAEELLEAVRARLRRAPLLRPKSAVQEAALARIVELLTTREKQVLGLVGRGLATKEIALDLGISPRTVEAHRANLMRKLGLGNATAAARLAAEAGLT